MQNEKSECDCKERSCTNTCTKKHTCHIFWCEKCEPQRCEDMRAIPSKNPMEEKIKYPCCAECEIYLDYKDVYQCSDKDCKCHQPNQQEDWEKEEWGGWKIVSEMLDNPDENGIYNTSKCYKKLYDFVCSLIEARVQEARLEGIQLGINECKPEFDIVRQEERQRILKAVKEKGLHLGYKNELLDIITNES